MENFIFCLVWFCSIFEQEYNDGVRCWWRSLHNKCLYSEFIWSVFSHIQIKYGDSLCKSPFLIWIRENTDQKSSNAPLRSEWESENHFRYLTLLLLTWVCIPMVFIIPEYISFFHFRWTISLFIDAVPSFRPVQIPVW